LNYNIIIIEKGHLHNNVKNKFGTNNLQNNNANSVNTDNANPLILIAIDCTEKTDEGNVYVLNNEEKNNISFQQNISMD